MAEDNDDQIVQGVNITQAQTTMYQLEQQCTIDILGTSSRTERDRLLIFSITAIALSVFDIKAESELTFGFIKIQPGSVQLIYLALCIVVAYYSVTFLVAAITDVSRAKAVLRENLVRVGQISTAYHKAACSLIDKLASLNVELQKIPEKTDKVLQRYQTEHKAISEKLENRGHQQFELEQTILEDKYRKLGMAFNVDQMREKIELTPNTGLHAEIRETTAAISDLERIVSKSNILLNRVIRAQKAQISIIVVPPLLLSITSLVFLIARASNLAIRTGEQPLFRLL